MDTIALARLLLVFLAGAASWTLVEYLLHRFGMHALKGRGLASREHLRHHAIRGYYATAVQKGLSAAAFLAALAPLLAFVVGPVLAAAGCAGFVTAYLGYEWLHRRAHTHAPRSAYGRWLRIHHFRHHFEAPLANLGVTTAVWDRLFGTLRGGEGPVRVPRRFANDWLLAADGELRPELRSDYVLVGLPAQAQPEGQAACDERDAFASAAPAA
jgi:sterol desaturase/sphingolipid hydroxylase (fatty acid hydroxylase superfamily)